MKREIYTYGQAVLREKAKTIEVIDEKIQAVIDDMLETMYAEKGVGLAAEQVGLKIALCVIDVPAEYDVDASGDRENPELAMPLVLINPKIVAKSEETEVREEGCLSLPGVYVNVVRHSWVQVQWQDRNGQAHDLVVRGYVARAVQHELDHLEGVLLTDRVSAVKRIALAGKLRQLKKESLESRQPL